MVTADKDDAIADVWLPSCLQENISSGRASEGMLMLQQQHNPGAAAAVNGGDQAELLDKLDCGVKILSGKQVTWGGCMVSG